MLYILDHYYAVDHPNYCLVIESDKSPLEIVEICSAITFLLEDVVDDGACLSMPCLLTILQKYYGVKNKKQDFSIDALIASRRRRRQLSIWNNNFGVGNKIAYR